MVRAKRGLSDIIVNVLLILIVLLSLSIIALFVFPFLKSSTSDTTFAERLATILTLPENAAYSNNTNKNVTIVVSRGAGGANVTGILILLEDNLGNNERIENFVNEPLGEFESKSYNFLYTMPGNLTKVKVVALFRTESGTQTGDLLYILEFNPDTGFVIGSTYTVPAGPIPTPEEEPPSAQCSDGIDNDSDGANDSADYSCLLGGTREDTYSAQCQNGADDDGDLLIDLNDPGCANLQDNDEANVVSPPGTTTIISQYGITWTFSASTQYGQFANGDYWVIGPVTITSISPANTTVLIGATNYMINGWEVNSVVGKTSLDQRITGYQASSMPSLPYVAQPGSSILKGISIDLTSSSCHGENCIENASILTVLGSVPPNNGATSFRPPYVGTSKPLYSTNSLRYDLLPKLTAVSTGGEDASLNFVMSKFDGPFVDHLDAIDSQKIHPKRTMHTYSANLATDVAKSGLILLLNYPDVQKAPALIRYVQAGIDLHAMMKGGNVWAMGGGHGMGRKPLIVFAAVMLDNQTMKNDILAVNMPQVFHEDQNIWYSSKANNGQGQVLFGDIATSESPSTYWKIITGILNGSYTQDTGSKTVADPHGYTDGGHAPGGSYQYSAAAMPWKYESLLMRKISGAMTLWNNQYFFNYTDRWVGVGAWSQPDPCAPSNGLSISYGILYGLNSTGGCILDTNPADGIGRWTQCSPMQVGCHGYNQNGGNVASVFADNMWNSYRYDFTCGNNILEAPAEDCDDGNTNNGDGCNEFCHIEGSISGPGLVAAYTFDNDLADHTGNGHNAFTLGTSGSYSYIPGVSGSALRLYGVSGSCLEISDPSSLGINGAFSISAWVNHGLTSTDAGQRAILAKGALAGSAGVTEYYLALYPASGNYRPYGVTSNGSDIRSALSATNQALNSWQYLTITFNGTTPVLYVDGAVRKVGNNFSVLTQVNVGSRPLHIGCSGESSPANYLNGTIDELRIYNRALSAAEVLALNSSYDGLPRPPVTGFAISDISSSTSAGYGGLVLLIMVIFAFAILITFKRIFSPTTR